MLRLHLTPEDLGTVQVEHAPAPLLELGNIVRGRIPGAPTDAGRRLSGRPGADLDRELLMGLFLVPCTPGFLLPDLADHAAAIDAVCSVDHDRARRDLAENVASGYPPPSWMNELTRTGLGSLRLRRRLERALGRAVEALVEPVLEEARPRAASFAAGLETIQSAGGATATLGQLGDRVRLRGEVLEVDLLSGTQVDATTSTPGLRIVPSLTSHPSITISTTGAPTTIMVPLPRPPHPTDAQPDGPRQELVDLVGRTRAQLLVLVAREPGLGVRALARRLDIAPATASQHARVLRASGLVEVRDAGMSMTTLGLRLIRGR